MPNKTTYIVTRDTTNGAQFVLTKMGTWSSRSSQVYSRWAFFSDPIAANAQADICRYETSETIVVERFS